VTWPLGLHLAWKTGSWNSDPVLALNLDPAPVIPPWNQGAALHILMFLILNLGIHRWRKLRDDLSV
jgi:hypothetical protein